MDKIMVEGNGNDKEICIIKSCEGTDDVKFMQFAKTKFPDQKVTVYIPKRKLSSLYLKISSLLNTQITKDKLQNIISTMKGVTALPGAGKTTHIIDQV
jgi:hypothetical protein